MEKKLGRYYLIELIESVENTTIQLYKKWEKNGAYESTDYILEFTNKELAIDMFKKINLSNIKKYIFYK